jgi:MFS transporter, LPLT family, lysophospholipid transporter
MANGSAAIQPQARVSGQWHARAVFFSAVKKSWYKACNPAAAEGIRHSMNRGFYTIMAAQFFSSLADNALLIASIAQLLDLDGPAWMTPLLKFSFTVSYVVLAPFVGAFADSIPKGRVMFVTNAIKTVGCIMMFFVGYVQFVGIPDYVLVLGAYAVVGFGAAAYSPAKYGLLTELLPAEKLVAANGWIEGLTVLSIIMGTVLGGALISPRVASMLLAIDVPHIDTGIETPAEAAILVISVIYVIAAIFNLFIPDTGARYKRQETNPVLLVRDFHDCFVTLWKDKLGQVSLAVTTLFWGAGATLQFIVLAWADAHLGLPLDKGALLQGVTSVGVAVGAVLAGRFVSLKHALWTLPFGVAMGITIVSMIFVTNLPVVYVLLIMIGAMAGFFVVPMNALLQHRGYVLLSAGHSIAVQNFNENISILVMLAVYSAMIRSNLHINVIIVVFGSFMSLTMLAVIQRYRRNQRDGDLLHLIGIKTSVQRDYP